MKRLFPLTLLALSVGANAQTQIETSELSTLYTTSSPATISIHDPSVLNRGGNYYIWGSHRGMATSSDLVTYSGYTASSSTFTQLSEQGASSGTSCTYADAFNYQQVTQVKNYLGETVDFPNLNVVDYTARYDEDPSTHLDGNMWAPDIIYNTSMKKWCLYFSINGDNWASVIVLLTASNYYGPYTYQGPIIMGGFNGQTYSGVSAPGVDETDLAIATGETTLPSRYKQSSYGTYWPNAIDPCVFYDEDGELWMTYGSWSGGIFMIKLDKETGLRDYTYTYESDFSTSGASGTSDPYFGKKIAGGYYVSGEGSYIQHIGDYYYLFVSYGAYAPDGGYDMRVFRSTSPDGTYTDATGNAATYTNYQLNYGPSAATNRGMHLMGAYNEWGGIQTIGECAQGHNSATSDDSDRNFVMYHTKFNDGTDGHQVRTHQLFLNQNNWLVVAPFIYEGEEQTDATIASEQRWTLDELAGDYQVLLHPYKLDHSNYEEVVPSTINLATDGTVSGDLSGTWGITEGTGYMWIKVSSVTYYGVFCEQTINGATENSLVNTSLKAIAFTSTASSGVPLWGYKLEPQSAIAWNYANNTINVKNGQTISSNVSLMFDTDNNTTLTWTSSHPDIISETGKYSPADTATSVVLTARLECGDYYWEESYSVTAQKKITLSGDYLTGIVAYYNFDETPTYNQYKASTETDYDRATYGKFSSGTAPSLVEDYDRFGQVAHIEFGANGYNSYVRIPNPLYEATDLEGFTVSLWVKRTDEDLWDAIWGFFNTLNATSSSYPRFYLTGNSYVGYNDADETWFDLNYPDVTYSNIPVGEWTLVTVTVGSSNYVRIYINGANKSFSAISASNSATAVKNLPYDEVVTDVTALKYFYLGNGSFWGSADCYVDDLLIYNRELSASDVRALNSMSNRVTDFTVGENGTAVENIYVNGSTSTSKSSRYSNRYYDLSGRQISSPSKHGIYIINGKKVVK